MSDINPSAIGERFDAEFKKQVANCTTAAEISELMKNRSISMGLAHREWGETLVVPNDRPAVRGYAKSITVNGQKRIFEAESELELERNVGDYFRALQGAQQTNPARQQQQTDKARGADGRFVEAGKRDEAAAANQERNATLQLQFQLKQIDSATYLEQSGAIDSYLANCGIIRQL